MKDVFTFHTLPGATALRTALDRADGLIMANGARAEGIGANLFFTFLGLDAISRKRHEHIKVASVGNPACTRPPSSTPCPACPACSPLT